MDTVLIILKGSATVLAFILAAGFVSAIVLALCSVAAIPTYIALFYLEGLSRRFHFNLPESGWPLAAAHLSAALCSILSGTLIASSLTNWIAAPTADPFSHINGHFAVLLVLAATVLLWISRQWGKPSNDKWTSKLARTGLFKAIGSLLKIPRLIP